jgi:hypothetical protein
MSIRPRPSASLSDEPGLRDPARATTIVMSPHKLLSGIAFHLIDNRHAVAIDDRARLKTLGRLRRHGFRACVTRTVWEGMGNAERLDWMLAVSDTTFMLTADRVAILKRRKH